MDSVSAQEHPLHQFGEDEYGLPLQPVRYVHRRFGFEWPTSQQRERERGCARSGGHWWHPVSTSLVEWFCCQCGREHEGNPGPDGQGQ